MDAAIDQNARVQVREIFRLLISSVTGFAELEQLPSIGIVLRENIPNDSSDADSRANSFKTDSF
jgi:hypothetical protein